MGKLKNLKIELSFKYIFAFLISSSLFVGILFGIFACTKKDGDNGFQNVLGNSLVRSVLDETIQETKNTDRWPASTNIEGQVLQFHYTFNEELNDYVMKMLKRYRSDYASVVVIDNETGKILVATGLEGKSRTPNKELVFSSTHPSASLFKIVTSAELLKNPDIDPDTSFSFTGRGSTMYKYQLKNKANKWTRFQTLTKAFALSNNVIFGKVAINKLSKDSLLETAEDFGFNQELLDEITLSQSQLIDVKDDDLYSLAELASGFNDQTLIGPIHGALISSVFANDGYFKTPYFVEEITDLSTGKALWRPHQRENKILEKDVVEQMQKMMTATVTAGTGREGFKKMNRKIKNRLYIGGKTGSITGGIPHGKRDWFTAYAVPRNKEEGKGISVCVMIVNLEKWYVRSSLLAKDVIEYYFKNIRPKAVSVKESVPQVTTKI